jgi:hypothetical protein
MFELVLLFLFIIIILNTFNKITVIVTVPGDPNLIIPGVTTKPSVTQPVVTTQPVQKCLSNSQDQNKVGYCSSFTNQKECTTDNNTTMFGCYWGIPSPTQAVVTTKPSVTTQPSVTTKPSVTTQPSVTIPPQCLTFNTNNTEICSQISNPLDCEEAAGLGCYWSDRTVIN